MPFEFLAQVAGAIGDAVSDILSDGDSSGGGGGGTDTSGSSSSGSSSGSKSVSFGSSDNWGSGANESYRYSTDMTINGRPVVSDSSGNLAVNNGGTMEPVTKNDSRITTK